ncbi:peptide/nickel transport system ATP-binding protein [Rhizobiales bacterium GAS191]|nr:peptide/nickel transport system ATP-binding protein [Rhizobiales bacterium GAS191]
MKNGAGVSAPLLVVKDLSIKLPHGADRELAVSNISFDLREGEILCVVGESGSGKSVLSSAIMGAVAKGLRIDRGSILFRGEDIVTMKEAQRRRLRGNRVAMVFQEPMAALNPAIKAGRQVEEVLLLHAQLSAEERRAKALALLASTHLPDPPRIHDSFPHQLSGGQCQRVVIAMALAMNPAVLIADEPTSALDVTTQAQVLKLFRELKDQHRHGVVFITHDFGVVAEVADRVAVMQAGEMVEIGETRQVLDNPRHPYTQKLIAAVPRAAAKAALAPLDGPPAIELSHLSKIYQTGSRRVVALNDVSLSLAKGHTLGIVGESGSGKSTLAKVAVRLVAATSGAIRVGDVDFAKLAGRALKAARRKIQMIFQDPYGSLNPRHRVGPIIARAAALGGMPGGEARERAKQLLSLVGLSPEAYDRKPDQFSGGQRQRIGIARALAMNPEVVLADECVSALDVSVQKQVLQLIADLQQQFGITLLFITHDLRVAAQVSDYIAVMRKGELVEFGPATQVLVTPKHAYTQELLAAAPGRAWLPG